TATLTAGNFELKIGRGGSISGVTLGGTAVNDATRAFAGGFFIRDQSAASNWIHPGGVVEANATTAWQKADVAELGLRFAATFSAMGDRIAVHADLTDMGNAERAVTLFFALPLAMTGWRFGDDVRRERAVSGNGELSRVSQEWNIGAVGAI